MDNNATFHPIEKSQSFNIKNHINNYLQAIDLKNSSKQTYQSQLMSFAAWLRKKGIFDPTEQTIIDFYDYLKNDKCLSILSIKGHITAIKSFFAWLKSVNIYPDIADKIQGPQKIAARKKESLTSQEVKRILKAIDCKTLEGKRDFALISLIIVAGLRSIEITQILRGDIANCCGSQLLWIKSKEGNGKNESILLSDKLFKPINDYLEARKSTSDTEPLFASHSKKNFGQPLTTRSVSRIIKKRLKAVIIDNRRITTGSLRYTAVRLNLLAWATPEQANSMMQTADIHTMLTYTRQLKNKHVG